MFKPTRRHLFALSMAAMMMPLLQALAADFEFGPKKTDDGLYSVSLNPANPADVKVGPIHVWILKVADNTGAPVTGATIRVDGGMSGHGHGLPTAPEAVGEEVAGEYRIDGVKFSMGGKWQLRFEIEAAAGTDRVEFELEL